MVRGDQCQYGAVAATGKDKGQPVKKPTGFMSNSPGILHVLSRVCAGRQGYCSRPEKGRHALCSGKTAKEAATYPRELCRAVLRGLTSQLRKDGRMIGGCYGIQVKEGPASGLTDDADAMAEQQLFGPAQGYSGKYKDDLTKQPLRDDFVKAARAKELEFFCSNGVWLKVPTAVVRTDGHCANHSPVGRREQRRRVRAQLSIQARRPPAEGNRLLREFVLRTRASVGGPENRNQHGHDDMQGPPAYLRSKVAAKDADELRRRQASLPHRYASPSRLTSRRLYQPPLPICLSPRPRHSSAPVAPPLSHT